jgi:predicted transcriptional regulator
MASETVRIDPDTHAKLKDLADMTGEPMTALLGKAVEAYRRQKFLEGANADYAALRDDPDAWAEELAERALWDCTLSDGLDAEQDAE